MFFQASKLDLDCQIYLGNLIKVELCAQKNCLKIAYNVG